MLTAASASAQNPDTAANEPEPASVVCGLELTSDNTEINNARLLTPIPFHYSLKFKDTCILKLAEIRHHAMNCTKPVIQTHLDAQPNVLVSEITMSCQYKRPGIYYSVPIAFDITSPSTFGLQRVYPQARNVTVAPYDEDFDPSRSIDADLKLFEWKSLDPKCIAVFASIIVLSAVCLGIAISRRRRKVPHVDKPAEKPKAPLEVFLSEISKLIEQTPATTDEYKAFHDCMSNALRRLIQSLFAVEAMSMTTQQLISTLLVGKMPPDICEKTRQILSASDYVKFTLEVPSKTKNVILLRDAQNVAIELNDFAIRRDKEIRQMSEEGIKPAVIDADIAQTDRGEYAESGALNTADMNTESVSDVIDEDNSNLINDVTENSESPEHQETSPAQDAGVSPRIPPNSELK